MIFEYSLTGNGLAEVSFAHGPRSVRFKQVNTWSDALGDLCGVFIELIENYGWKDEPEEPAEDRTLVQKSDVAELMWFSDPYGWKWLMELHHDLKLDIKIKYFDDIYAEGAEGWEIFAVKTDLIELLTEVVRALEEVLRKHGFVGYRVTWGAHDFPLSRYLMLCRFLSNASRYSITKEQQAALKTSTLRDELQWLGKLG